MRIDDANEDTTLCKVVVNHEEQYSIWPADRENPAGWNDAGRTGTKAECLAYIREVWTDRRPKSLRDSMDMGLGVPVRDPEAGPNRGCPV
ncbi:MAG TPA: MbtH family protein [Allosphingosinicella sp.]|jgi:MbtH protein